MPTKHFNHKYLLEKRKSLRNNSTMPEILLWKRLQNSQLAGRKFRRQQAIGSYIVDFYCSKEGLVIELDGDSHFIENAEKYDAVRTDFLKSLGLSVLRFSNSEIAKNLDGVVEEIMKNFGVSARREVMLKNELKPSIPASLARRGGVSAANLGVELDEILKNVNNPREESVEAETSRTNSPSNSAPNFVPRFAQDSSTPPRERGGDADLKLLPKITLSINHSLPAKSGKSNSRQKLSSALRQNLLRRKASGDNKQSNHPNE